MIPTAKPDILYHYTSMEGLVGILENKTLWATKIHYLNDASELTKSLTIAKEVLEESLIETNKEDEAKLKIIRQMIGYINSSGSTNWCVASFCTKGDLLSQWRGYGIYGSAYSIGFDTKKLEKSINASKFVLDRCGYFNDKEYREEINKFIIDFIKGSHKVGYFINNFIKRAALLKMDCFQEEDEWRILPSSPMSYASFNFRFRVGKSMIVPYFELPIETSSIVKVVIGPCQHPNLVRDTITGMFYRYGFSSGEGRYPRIEVSKIPYRVI